MFEYELKFDPPINSRDERFKLINQLKEVFGPIKTFYGVCLYLPHILKDDPTFLNANHPGDNTEISVTANLKHIKKISDSKTIQF